MKLKGKESKIISKSQPSSSESPADAPTDLKAGGMVEQSFPPKETRLLLVAGTQSGVGKTSIAIGLMAAFRRRGLAVQPFKVGPDFIDPLHHLAASGRRSFNLDGWMLNSECALKGVRARTAGASVAVVEGVMGLFDGFDGNSDTGSTAQMAKWLGAPVLLVVDCWAMGRSIAALVKGFTCFDDDVNIVGLLLNKIGSPAHAEWLCASLKAAKCRVPVVGCIPQDLHVSLPEDHLGLHHPGTTPRETLDNTSDTQYIQQLANMLEAHVDLDALLALGSLVHPDPSASSRESGAGSPGGALDEKALRHLRGVARVNSSAPATPSASGAHARGSLDTMPQRVYSQSERGGSPLSAKERALSYDEAAGARAGGRAHSVSGIDMGPQPSHASVHKAESEKPSSCKIGVAWDAAFCFYYHENLELLRDAGAELCFFSPIADLLPEGLHGIYLGGGYPEMHAAELAANKPLLAAVQAFAKAGGVVYGECGGLMYLGKSIQCNEDETHDVCGVFEFRTRMVKDTKMGYVEVHTQPTCRLFPPNQTARGQVYHFFQVVYERVVSGLSNGADVPWNEDYVATLQAPNARPVFEGYALVNVLASYVHLHFGSNPAFPAQLVQRCAEVGAVPAAAARTASDRCLAAMREEEQTRELEQAARHRLAQAPAAAHAADAALPEVGPSKPGAGPHLHPGTRGGEAEAESNGATTGFAFDSSYASPPQIDVRHPIHRMALAQSLPPRAAQNQHTPPPQRAPSEGFLTPIPYDQQQFRAQEQAEAASPLELEDLDSAENLHLRAERGVRYAPGAPPRSAASCDTAREREVANNGAAEAKAGEQRHSLHGDHRRSQASLTPPDSAASASSSVGRPAGAGQAHRPSRGAASYAGSIDEMSNMGSQKALSLDARPAHYTPDPMHQRTLYLTNGASPPADAGPGRLEQPAFCVIRDGRTTFKASKTPGASICSLVPSATEILYALGVGDRVTGVSDCCELPSGRGKGRGASVVTRTRLPAPGDPVEDDSAVWGTRYSFDVDTEWFRRERPGLVITQDNCSTPAEKPNLVLKALVDAQLIGPHCMGGTTVMMVRPRTFADILESVVQIGAAAGCPAAATRLVDELRLRIRGTVARVALAPFRPRVLCLSGSAPFSTVGHWVPEMMDLAGGVDESQEPGVGTVRLRWEQVLAYSPDVLMLAVKLTNPSDEHSLPEVANLASQPGWWALRAVQKRQVYLVDTSCFSHPGPKIVDGVDVLARILHPELIAKKLPDKMVLKLWMRDGDRCRPRKLRNFFLPYN